MLLASATLVSIVVVHSTLTGQITSLTRRLGGNPLWIFPPDTDLGRYYTTGLVDGEFSQDLVDELFHQKGEFIRHLVPKLHTSVSIDGRSFILTGVGPESDIETPPKPIAPSGHVLLGAEVAARTGLKPGSTVKLLGRDFAVEAALTEEATLDDLRIFAPLDDVQQLLGKDRVISMIEGLPCRCVPGARFASEAQRMLQAHLGERAQVVLLWRVAQMRAHTREAVENVRRILLPVLTVLSGLIVGVTVLGSMRSRRPEFAVLLALGFRPRSILLMNALKVVMLGLTGGLLGWVTGSVVMGWLGPVWLEARVVYPATLLPWTLLFATGLALVFSLPALILAMRTDPARMLNEDVI